MKAVRVPFRVCATGATHLNNKTVMRADDEIMESDVREEKL